MNKKEIAVLKMFQNMKTTRKFSQLICLSKVYIKDIFLLTFTAETPVTTTVEESHTSTDTPLYQNGESPQINGDVSSIPQTSIPQLINQQQTVQSPLTQFLPSSNQTSFPQFLPQTQGQTNLTQLNLSQIPILQSNGQVIPANSTSTVPQVIQNGVVQQLVQTGVTPQVFQAGVNTPQIIQNGMLPQVSLAAGTVVSPGPVGQASQVATSGTQVVNSSQVGGAQVIQLQGLPGNMIQIPAGGGQQIMVC